MRKKSNRIQIAVSKKNAKTIRKMCVQKHKNVISNVKGKKSLSGNTAVTLARPFCILSWKKNEGTQMLICRLRLPQQNVPLMNSAN